MLHNFMVVRVPGLGEEGNRFKSHLKISLCEPSTNWVPF